MGDNENIENEILRQHIDNIRQQLKDLNFNYNLNYIFGFAFKKNHITLDFERGMYYNKLINLAVLNDFILDLISLKRDLVFWLQLIRLGKHVVCCIDDGNQQGGDKLINGDFYFVQQIFVDKEHDTLQFYLQGMHSGSVTGGYDFKRFIRLINYTDLN